MKFMSILILVAVLVVLPLYALNNMLLPILDGMQQQYTQTAAAAEAINAQ